MNQKKASGIVVFQEGKPVGMLTERSLLRRFVKLDKRPDEVKVKDVMTPLMKISADASVKDAATPILENGLTRLGVFDGQKLDRLGHAYRHRQGQHEGGADAITRASGRGRHPSRR
jgi:CBS domain-containing protein